MARPTRGPSDERRSKIIFEAAGKRLIKRLESAFGQALEYTCFRRSQGQARSSSLYRARSAYLETLQPLAFGGPVSELRTPEVRSPRSRGGAPRSLPPSPLRSPLPGGSERLPRRLGDPLVPPRLRLPPPFRGVHRLSPRLLDFSTVRGESGVMPSHRHKYRLLYHQSRPTVIRYPS